MKTKRALIRAVEKQAEMEERMDLLKASCPRLTEVRCRDQLSTFTSAHSFTK